MRNETAAVHQQLTTLYTNQIGTAQQRLDLFWTEWEQQIANTQSLPSSERFAVLVRSNLVSSAIIQPADGKLGYPSDLGAWIQESQVDPPGWNEARRLEFQDKDFAAAANAYEIIANATTNAMVEAKVRTAQANSLIKAGRKSQALELLIRLADNKELIDQSGSPGALLIPNLFLRILKLIEDHTNEDYLRIKNRLIDRINDYSSGAMLAAQRRFLMDQVIGLQTSKSNDPQEAKSSQFFPTFRSEQMAAAYLEGEHPAPSDSFTSYDEPSKKYHLMTGDPSVTALLEEADLRNLLKNKLKAALALGDASIELLAPGEPRSQNNPVPVLTASTKLPDWSMAIVFSQADPFQTSIQRQRTFYVMTGALIIGSIALVVVLMGRQLLIQMRLAQMKNELVSTVSHELKTPLASMKALVETLLAGRIRNEQQQRDYLELIAKENTRLSHLIENFLTFSRLERGRQRFNMQSLSPIQITEHVIDALHERLHAPGCHFSHEIEKHLPMIEADFDAITTVLINLLDNAIKYTNEHKVIQLRVSHDNSGVSFEVQDNGIGFSSKEKERVFERFHQLNQGLTRERGGCGLGLSIVRSIVQAHHGFISVKSVPNQGSTFRVQLPVSKHFKGDYQ